MIEIQIKPANHIITAYNQMMIVMQQAFKQHDNHPVTLQNALKQAKQKAERSGEVTAEEAYEIGEYIKRDINDAAEYLMETSAEFGDWLALDIETIERKVVNLYLSAAILTRNQLEQFQQPKRLTHNSKFHLPQKLARTSLKKQKNQKK